MERLRTHGASLEAIASWGACELLRAAINIISGPADEAAKKTCALGLLSSVRDACGDSSFLCSQLEAPVSTLAALIAPNDTSLTDLEVALGHVAGAAAQASPAPDSLEAWLRTPGGRRVVQRAEASMGARQCESEAQALVELAKGRVQALQNLTAWSEEAAQAVADLQKFVSEMSLPEPGQAAAAPLLCTQQQREEMQALERQGWASAHKLISQDLSARWCATVTVALQAAHTGGVVETNGVPGLLKTNELVDRLTSGSVQAAVLLGPGAQVLTGGLGGSVEGLLCEHGKDVQLFAGIVDYFFSVTIPRPLFLDPVPLADLSAFSAGGLKRWGLDERCTDEIESNFCHRVRQEAAAVLQREAEGAFGRLRGVVAACTRGEVGGLDDALVQSLLKPLPANSLVTTLVSDFLQAELR